MSYCQGNIEGCQAEEWLCSICGDVMACSEHGHVDAGAVERCPYKCSEKEEEKA